MQQQQLPMYYKNYDLTQVVTPVKIENLKKLLVESKYDQGETNFLIEGFTNGFEIGYEGDLKVKMKSPNLKFQEGVGDEVVLWNKVMKEVKVGHYAGPFEDIPFEFFIQSPIGLVPKDQNDTRLIFHLSYPRKSSRSLNQDTPWNKTSVSYPAFDDAIKLCIIAGKNCHIAHSDMRSAFHNLGIRPDDWCLLIMKARSPFNNKYYYFVDKYMPFGAAISCSHFQRFSNAVVHIMSYRTGKKTINYLDDYLFIALLKLLCNAQVREFLWICEFVQFPVSMEKTFWATTCLTFLGLLIDTIAQTVSLPQEKICKGLQLIQYILVNLSKQAMVKQIQQLTGFLNFSCRCIIHGRAFTRRLYSLTVGKTQGKTLTLKPHYHVWISQETRLDLEMWVKFLTHPSIFCRPFMDFGKLWMADEISMFSDALRNFQLGFGGMCQQSWMFMQWDYQFMQKHQPSIAYLELFAVLAVVLTWIHRFQNKRVVLFCDNEGVVEIINNSSSKCKNCMVLVRLLVLHSLTQNVRVFAKHIRTKSNRTSDLLSRMKINQFKKENPNMEQFPTDVPNAIWPMEKIWMQ